MYQKVILVGNVGQQPELRKTPSDISVLNLSVAVSDRRGGNDTTIWFKCTAWRNNAENIAQYVNKGDMILVEGRMEEPNAWESNGEAKAQNILTIDSFKFMPRSTSNSEPRSTTSTESSVDEELGDIFDNDDEIPF